MERSNGELFVDVLFNLILFFLHSTHKLNGFFCLRICFPIKEEICFHLGLTKISTKIHVCFSRNGSSFEISVVTSGLLEFLFAFLHVKSLEMLTYSFLSGNNSHLFLKRQRATDPETGQNWGRG